MDIHAEKLSLIEWMKRLTDINTLNELISLKNSKDIDWWDELSKEERFAINEGLAQLDRGEGIPHEKVMTEIRKKYNL